MGEKANLFDFSSSGRKTENTEYYIQSTHTS